MMTLTKAIAFAAAKDAGNRHMRKFHRTSWNASDYRAACAEFERLLPSCVDFSPPATATDVLIESGIGVI
jgi:hypothetical protein